MKTNIVRIGNSKGIRLPKSILDQCRLKDSVELDRYTYLVAGCVGEFWTEMMAAHTRPLATWDMARMSELGVRFGKALQLTNVLRDVSKDLRLGRCYLPQTELEAAGGRPSAFPPIWTWSTRGT